MDKGNFKSEKPQQSRSQFLVITRAGRNSFHQEWVQPTSDRNFDVMISSYEPLCSDTLPSGSQEVFTPGKKVAGLNIMIRNYAAHLDHYPAIALIDDDIYCNATTISQCFSTGMNEGFAIWQPSLSEDSFFTYAGTIQNRFFISRSISFVEMMTPFFTREALRVVAPTFELGLESGIDLVWPSLLAAPNNILGIVDKVCVRHTRPVGAEMAKNGFEGRGYESDIEACLANYNLRWPLQIAYAGKTIDGKEAGLLKTSFLTFWSLIRFSLKRLHYRLRPVLVHLRHQSIAAIQLYASKDRGGS